MRAPRLGRQGAGAAIALTCVLGAGCGGPGAQSSLSETPVVTAIPTRVPEVRRDTETPQALLAAPSPAAAVQAAAIRACVAKLNDRKYRFSYMLDLKLSGIGDSTDVSVRSLGDVASSSQMHLWWRNMATGETFEGIRVDNRTWQRVGDQYVEKPFAETMARLGVYTPSSVWQAIGDDLSRRLKQDPTEVVDGRRTVVFSGDARSDVWSVYGVVNSGKERLWLDQDTLSLARYELSAVGEDLSGADTTLRIVLEVTSASSDLEVRPPR